MAKALRPAWLPKVSQGFFFRSDTFADVARYIDDDGAPYEIHGGPLGDPERYLKELFADEDGVED